MTFREMRRSRQALSQADCEKILKTATAGVLAVTGDGGYPYAVPLSYVYAEGRLYFHCAGSGHKLDAISADDRVSFCVIDRDEIHPEKFTTFFRSVILFGTARELEDGRPESGQAPVPSRGSWRLLPLSAILTERREYAKKDGTYPHVSLTKDGVIPKTARYDRDFLVKTAEKAYKVTRLNDICCNPANLKFGVICRNRLGDGIFSPIYATFSVNDGFDPAFAELLVTRPSFLARALRYQEGTVYERMSVRPEVLLSLTVAVPEPELQREIAETARLLERQIQAEEAVLADLRQRKKGLLQEVLM